MKNRMSITPYVIVIVLVVALSVFTFTAESRDVNTVAPVTVNEPELAPVTQQNTSEPDHPTEDSEPEVCKPAHNPVPQRQNTSTSEVASEDAHSADYESVTLAARPKVEHKTAPMEKRAAMSEKAEKITHPLSNPKAEESKPSVEPPVTQPMPQSNPQPVAPQIEETSEEIQNLEG